MDDIDFNKELLHIAKELSRVDKSLFNKLNRNDILYIFPSKTTVPTKTALVLKSPKTQSSITYKLLIIHGDIKSTQGDTGHSQVRMITDIYSHILDSERKNTAALSEDFFYTNCLPTIN